MKEDQIESVPFVSHGKPFRPAHKSEIIPEFQEEVLQVTNECFLKIALRILVFNIQKLERDWIYDLFLRREYILRTFFGRELSPRALRTFVELRRDLPI